MISRIIFLFSLLFLLNDFAIAQNESVLINELMSVNTNSIADEDGNYSDWIEIFNSGSHNINLYLWSLTDDPQEERKWVFPDIILPANSYLLIFASGKDKRDSTGTLHTSFKLSSAGEYLGLHDSTGNLICSVDPYLPDLNADISYGLLNDNYVKFKLPTPGSVNLESGSQIVNPKFSVKHGVYDQSFQLELFSEGSDINIFFTLDGSVPDTNTGILYSNPLTIDSTSVVRAIAIKNNSIPSEVVTQTYLFPKYIVNQPNSFNGYPVEWGPFSASQGRAPADYEMDPELMQDSVFKKDVIASFDSLPIVSLVTDANNLFSMSTAPDTGGIYMYPAPNDNDIGRGWERPVSFEYFNKNQSESVQINCGVTINGGQSRVPEKSPKHSFRLYFRSEYGSTKLKYQIFEDSDINSFNTLVLRGGFNNTWIHWDNEQRSRTQIIRDNWIKATQKDMGHLSAHTQYVHLFINGIYWGVYIPSERMDKDFAAAYLDGSPDEFDVIKDYNEVANGNIFDWKRLIAYANVGLSSNEAYQKIQGKNPDGTNNPDYDNLLDVENLTDYMLINIYGGNTDWDHHNWTAVRNRNNSNVGFNFVCWDSEHTMKSLTENVVNENNRNCPSNIYNQLKQNRAFKVYFADQVQKHFYNSGQLTPEMALERWERLEKKVEPAIKTESARWGDYRRDVHPYRNGPYELYTYEDHWLPQNDWIKNIYLKSRSQRIIEQLRQEDLFPDTEAPSILINSKISQSEIVKSGDQLSLNAPKGFIYYTLDGTDPVEWSHDFEIEEKKLIEYGATKYVYIPKNHIGDEWRSDLNYDTGGWLTTSGLPGGVGYEKGSGYQDKISLDIAQDMYTDGNSPNTSCYIRIPFTINDEELASIQNLKAEIYYDDGFAIYLNGTRIAGMNSLYSPIWSSASTAQHEANESTIIDLSSYSGLLKSGNNLLALHGLNASTTSSDFLISIELFYTKSTKINISENATAYTSPLTLDSSVFCKARAFFNGEWSALAQGSYIFPNDFKNLKVTEISYNPLNKHVSDQNLLEFIELKNTGNSTLNLEGLEFLNGIKYYFDEITILNPGEFIVLAANSEQFFIEYDFYPDGVFKGKLDNGGEWLTAVSHWGDTIIHLYYDDVYPWPSKPDGYGNTLVPMQFNPLGGQNNAYEWRESYLIGGSPGKDDLLQTGTIEPLATFSNNQFLIYPNPFNEITQFSFSINEDAYISLTVYNLLGQKVVILAEGWKHPGQYLVNWNGLNQNGKKIEAGVYFGTLVTKIGDKNMQQSLKLIYY